MIYINSHKLFQLNYQFWLLYLIFSNIRTHVFSHILLTIILALILKDFSFSCLFSGLPWWLSGKESTCNAGDPASIPESGRSPGGGHGNPLQCSCLENPMERGAWQEQSIVSQRVGHNWSSWACLFSRVMLFFPYQLNTSYLILLKFTMYGCMSYPYFICRQSWYSIVFLRGHYLTSRI